MWSPGQCVGRRDVGCGIAGLSERSISALGMNLPTHQASIWSGRACAIFPCFIGPISSQSSPPLRDAAIPSEQLSAVAAGMILFGHALMRYSRGIRCRKSPNWPQLQRTSPPAWTSAARTLLRIPRSDPHFLFAAGFSCRHSWARSVG